MTSGSAARRSSRNPPWTWNVFDASAGSRGGSRGSGSSAPVAASASRASPAGSNRFTFGRLLANGSNRGPHAGGLDVHGRKGGTSRDASQSQYPSELITSLPAL